MEYEASNLICAVVSYATIPQHALPEIAPIVSRLKSANGLLVHQKSAGYDHDNNNPTSVNHTINLGTQILP